MKFSNSSRPGPKHRVNDIGSGKHQGGWEENNNKTKWVKAESRRLILIEEKQISSVGLGIIYFI